MLVRETHRPAPLSTVDAQPQRGWWSRRAAAEPAPAPATRSRPVRALTRAVRRLVALVAVLVTVAVVALVGTAALLGTTPGHVATRVSELVDQVRTGGGP